MRDFENAFRILVTDLQNMRYLFILLLFPSFSFAQPSLRVDSALIAIKSELPKNQAKKINQIRNQFLDSCTYKRIDSTNSPFVIIRTSYVGSKITITEFYYTYADSAPSVVFVNNLHYIQGYNSPVYSYNTLMKEADALPLGVSKREYKFVQEYRHGCLVPRRLFARKMIKARLNVLSVVIFIDHSKNNITTKIVCPRRFHPFILHMTGGKW